MENDVVGLPLSRRRDLATGWRSPAGPQNNGIRRRLARGAGVRPGVASALLPPAHASLSLRAARRHILNKHCLFLPNLYSGHFTGLPDERSCRSGAAPLFAQPGIRMSRNPCREQNQSDIALRITPGAVCVKRCFVPGARSRFSGIFAGSALYLCLSVIDPRDPRARLLTVPAIRSTITAISECHSGGLGLSTGVGCNIKGAWGARLLTQRNPRRVRCYGYSYSRNGGLPEPPGRPITGVRSGLMNKIPRIDSERRLVCRRLPKRLSA